MRRLVLALAALVCVTGSVSVADAAVSCRSSFLGCRTRAQRVRFCQAACTTTRTVCRTTFSSGKLQRRCAKRALRVCLGEGGTCIRACDSAAACRAGEQCASGQCIMAEPCRTACGASCCGGDYPYCGPEGRCWTKPCQTLCGDTCCGGDSPVCDGGHCSRGPTIPSDGFPTNLPPGTYALTFCISGVVSVPCQAVGTLPLTGLAAFESAIQTALDQWLAATAGSECTRGAATYSAFDGSAFTATATATCGPYSSTVQLVVRHL